MSPIERCQQFMAQHPLATALCTGAFLRGAAAFTGYGWFAPDDYEFGVQQAGIWLQDPQAPFPCDFRSPLLSRFFWLLMWLSAQAGVQGHATQLQCAYAGLGLFSCLAIVAVYGLAAPLGRQASFAAAMLTAGYALMPRISTRAMIEVVAIVPLTWGTLCLHRARTDDRPFKNAMLAGLGLGLATLLRFQMGILFAAAAGLWVFDASHKSARAPWRGLGGLVVGGALMAAIQGLMDVLMKRPFLATPWRYVAFNIEHASTYGTSPWYTYLLHFVVFTLPPVTLLLLRPMGRTLRQQSTVAVLGIAFIAVHSCIGHKEDRFMFPMLPFLFVPLGAALVHLAQGNRLQRAGYRLFVAVNAIALVVSLFSDAHRNIAAPLLEASRFPGARVATIGFGWVPTFYAGRASVRQFADLNSVEQAAAGFDYVLFRHPPTPAEEARVRAMPGLQCEPATLFSGDWGGQGSRSRKSPQHGTCAHRHDALHGVACSRGAGQSALIASNTLQPTHSRERGPHFTRPAYLSGSRARP